MNLTREDKMAAARVRMSELATKFIERSAGELDVLRARLASLSGGDVDALGDILHLAHRMTGTGATLGFEALSDCAMRLERNAGKLTSGVVPDESALTQLGVGIEAIGAELARLRPGHP
jgi:HPt (histidine-containing phosphotransfer) domain-containing protein